MREGDRFAQFLRDAFSSLIQCMRPGAPIYMAHSDTGGFTFRRCFIEAGFKLSITVLLGIAGRERSQLHARETGRVLSAIDPDYVGALSLMLIPGTPLYEEHRAGRFPCSNPRRCWSN